MCLVYGVLLLFGLYLANNPVAENGFKLGALVVPSVFLAAAVLLASFLSSAASHRAYWRAIFP